MTIEYKLSYSAVGTTPQYFYFYADSDDLARAYAVRWVAETGVASYQLDKLITERLV